MATKKSRKKKTATATQGSRPTRAQAEAAIATILAWAGENPAREGLVETPARVVRAFEEYFAGYAQDPAQILSKTFSETGGYDQPVLLRDITFESRCEHHLAPFTGRAHIAYIPGTKIVGLSKLARLVDAFAKRMQTQERLTSEIASALQKHLKPKGVAVVIEAEHFCMKLRGARKQDAVMVTSKFTGAYLKDDDLREALYLQLRD